MFDQNNFHYDLGKRIQKVQNDLECSKIVQDCQIGSEWLKWLCKVHNEANKGCSGMFERNIRHNSIHSLVIYGLINLNYSCILCRTQYLFDKTLHLHLYAVLIWETG